MIKAILTAPIPKSSTLGVLQNYKMKRKWGQGNNIHKCQTMFLSYTDLDTSVVSSLCLHHTHTHTHARTHTHTRILSLHAHTHTHTLHAHTHRCTLSLAIPLVWRVPSLWGMIEACLQD